MRECIVIPTYRRTELLYCCLRRLQDQNYPVADDPPVFVFSDRGETSFELERTCHDFGATLIVQAKHNYHGNSFNSGQALRFAYESGFELIHYIEDDAFCKPDLLAWTRKQHEMWSDIFCSCGWVFNHHLTIEEQIYFVPWIYIPQFSIRREKLKLIAEHLNPLYYQDMWAYIQKHFRENKLNALYPDVVHYEIDGLIQRIIMEGTAQVVWNGIGKVEHMGMAGYNRGGYDRYNELFDSPKFIERVAKVENFAADPYWRMSIFGREIVEREIGHRLEKRMNRYRVTLPGGWESTFTSELGLLALPRRVNSVPVTPDMQLVVE